MKSGLKKKQTNQRYGDLKKKKVVYFKPNLRFEKIFSPKNAYI